MTNQPTLDGHDDASEVADQLQETGAAAFSDLKTSIHGHITKLQTDFGGDDTAKTTAVEGVVKTHLAEISKLLEVSHGESSENVLPTNPGNSLDLERARDKIRSRLVKLVEQRGS